MLSPEAIRADFARGELQIYRKGMKRVAVLLAPDGETYVLPLLDKVKLLAMNHCGVLLTGTEIYPTRNEKGTGPMYRQTWWCELNPKSYTAVADPAEARRRERERQARKIGTSLLRWPKRRGRYEPDDP